MDVEQKKDDTTTEPEHFKLRLEDLRTTTAPQSIGSMYNGGGYCCLGRACELYMTATKNGKWSHLGTYTDGRRYFETDDQKDTTGTYLPKCVQEWLGIEDSNPISIAHANDGGVSFSKIADILEEAFFSKTEEPK
jgi:hypothetical protein